MLSREAHSCRRVVRVAFAGTWRGGCARRDVALENRAAWMQIVHGGALSDNGMASFTPSLSEDEVEAVRQYVIKRANEDKAMEAERAKTRVARR